MSNKTGVPDKPDKLNKFLTSRNITLNRFISSERRNIFDVMISNTNNNRISSLMEAIRTKAPHEPARAEPETGSSSARNNFRAEHVTSRAIINIGSSFSSRAEPG
ncbi:hypothetical protein C1645_811028 [Glomus cerebriforme]|uniref:Uncharacterized protein n=1 Tax=Glomus cerebriforme TaxID=658196 RepID=A0A397TNB6_9GLOM|nr:hypothetical protein C1645_811028 [Glomus cerebriforme]